MLYLKAGNEPEGVKWVESAGGKGQPLALRMIEINKGYHGTNEYINAYKDKLKTEFEQNRTQIKSGIQGMLTR